MSNPAKARLVTIDKPSQMQSEKLKRSDGKEAIEVDFNPQTLKLTYANKTEGGKQAKPGESQFIGSIDASLAVELVFDSTQVHGQTAAGTDVRAKTQKIFKLLVPKEKKPKSTPPLVRFEWGSFLFEGLVKSMNETLEFFSSEGIPLRSTVSLNMTTTTDLLLFDEKVTKGKAADFNRTPPGTQPKQAIPPNESLQKAAGKNGDSSNWRAIAAANNIDNPLRPPAGVALNMSASASAGVSASDSAGASAGGSIGLSAGIGAGASIGGDAGIGGAAGAQAGFSAGIGGGIGFSAGASGGLSAGLSGGISGGVSGGVSGGLSGGISAGASAGFGAGGSASFGVGGGASLGGAIGGSASAGASFGVSGSAGASGNFGVRKRG